MAFMPTRCNGPFCLSDPCRARGRQDTMCGDRDTLSVCLLFPLVVGTLQVWVDTHLGACIVSQRSGIIFAPRTGMVHTIGTPSVGEGRRDNAGA
jgi:hypothetical protein